MPKFPKKLSTCVVPTDSAVAAARLEPNTEPESPSSPCVRGLARPSPESREEVSSVSVSGMIDNAVSIMLWRRSCGDGRVAMWDDVTVCGARCVPPRQGMGWVASHRSTCVQRGCLPRRQRSRQGWPTELLTEVCMAVGRRLTRRAPRFATRCLWRLSGATCVAVGVLVERGTSSKAVKKWWV